MSEVIIDGIRYIPEDLKEDLKLKSADKYFNLDELMLFENKYITRIVSNDKAIKAGFDSANFICVRNSGTYENRAFYLDDNYNWQILKDEWDCLCLVPTRK